MTTFSSGDNNVPAIDGEHSGSGTAIVANSVRGVGVHGVNDAPQGSSLKPDFGVGVWGESTNGFGVFGSADNNVGVKGVSSHDDGVQGRSSGPDHSGVSGFNTGGGIGIFGESTGNDGVQGNSQDPGHSGVAGFNQKGGTGVFGKSLGGRGIWGQGSPAGHFDGDVEVTKTITCFDVALAGADCAEEFDLAGVEDAPPGSVMSLDEHGRLSPSRTAYDRRVAGVLSGAGDYKPGVVLDRRSGERNRAPLALIGKVYCWVDADFGAIEVGDLLTTSPTQGHAMKVDDPAKAIGAIIGKALQRLTTRRGLIPILVTLL